MITTNSQLHLELRDKGRTRYANTWTYLQVYHCVGDIRGPSADGGIWPCKQYKHQVSTWLPRGQRTAAAARFRSTWLISKASIYISGVCAAEKSDSH